MSMWLINTAPVFAVAFAPDGNQADAGTVTVTVTRADGSVLAADAGTTKEGSGATTIYKWALPVAENSRVDVLTLEWTRTDTSETLTTTEELVGALLFTETQARGFDDQKLASTSDSDLVAARDRITDLFEDYCGQSFIPRYARVVFAGPSHRDPYRLPLTLGTRRVGGPGWPRNLRSIINADDDGSTVTDLVVDDLGVSRQDGTWRTPSTSTRFPQTLDYEYGLSPPRDIRHAALILARYDLVQRDITDRMISYDDGNLGSVRLSTPGPNRPTGIPIVDETLNRYRIQVPVA
jgi:hypothetical protein